MMNINDQGRRPKRCLVRGNKGFSLVESLVGTLIFMIGLIGISVLLLSNIKGSTFSGNLTEAVYLATNKLELLQAKPYSDSSLTDNQAVGETGYGSSGLNLVGSDADGMELFQGRNGIFTVCWNVAEDVPTTSSKTVNVLARWSEKGSSRTISFQGLVTN